jgi:peptide deformylase
MELAQKRAAVEADEQKQEARAALEAAMRERVPEAYREGNVLPLVLYPDPRLSTECAPVEKFDKELIVLVRDMALTMYLLGGVGLAASQVGKMKRLLVCDWGEKNGQLQVMINPVIVAESDECVELSEACLSIPGGKVHLVRPKTVTVRFQDIKGKSHDMGLTDWPARIVQHEMDHLDGKLMLDLASRLERRIALKKLGKIARGETAKGPKPRRKKKPRR